MSSNPKLGDQSGSSPGFIGAAQVVLLIVVAMIAMGLARRNPSATQLLPVLPSATQAAEGQRPVQSIAFTDLNADPFAYLNQPIEVSGRFVPLSPPACARYSGPQFSWALVSGTLQLDVRGFERILSLLSPETDMTVQGIWRVYQGPLGCGKGPAEGTAWYLQAQRIVQPNPLVGPGKDGIAIQDAAPGLPGLIPTIPPTPTSPATFTPTPEAEVTVAAPGAVDGFTPTTTSTPAGSGTAVPATTPTPNGGTSAPPAQITPGTTLSAPTATPPGTGPGTEATATPGTPLPPTATQTSGGGGYPGNPTETPDPNPYP